MEMKRRKRFFSSNNAATDNDEENGKKKNEKKNYIPLDENLEDNNCEKFSLTLSVPFLHSQHVRGGLTGDTSVNNEKPSGRDGVTDSEHMVLKDSNDINKNNNAANGNNNNDKKNKSSNNNSHSINSSTSSTAQSTTEETATFTHSLETMATNSIFAFSAALSPSTDGWTLLGGQRDGDGDGGKNPTPFGPIRPLFYPQQREEVSATCPVILQTTQTPCSGPGYPISPHSSGDIYFLFFTSYLFH